VKHFSDEGLALSVDEFCVLHRISRANFYLIVKAGRGPKIMKVGARTLISREAAADWRRRMEAAAIKAEGTNASAAP
jgi:hypothetical protein